MIDLAQIVRRIVVENPKVYPYIFAIDRSKKPTQKRIVTSIAKNMGTDKVDHVEPVKINQPIWQDRLSTNLKMKASDAFKDGVLTPEEEDNLEEEEKEALLKSRKFPWHSEKGIIGNVVKLNKEFNEFRGLNPVKIFITGPPASGKTFYAEKLAEYYNIPHVSVKQLTDEALRISNLDEEKIGENAFWLDIKAKCEEERTKMAT